MERVIDWLRPHPSRGDVIAAGAVPLSVLAFVIPLRMTQWATGPKFVVVALIAMLLFTMGWLAPLEGEAPRAYHTVLLVAGLLPMIVALVLFAELIGAAHPPGAGGFVWVLLIETALAWAAARRANSGACTLIAAAAGAGFVFAFVAWAFKPSHPRHVPRDGRRPDARLRRRLVAVARASAPARGAADQRRRALDLAARGDISGVDVARRARRWPAPDGFGFFGSLSAPFGWKLWILSVAFGLVAYAGVDRERGPAYIGVVMLLAFALLVGYPVSSRGSLVGWPLSLLIIGAGGLAIGLRPRAPLPPEPPTPPHVPPTVQPEPSPTERLRESPPPPPTIPLERSDDE